MKTPEEMAEEWANGESDFWFADISVYTKGHNDAVKQAFLAGYKAAQQWISVKNRLPEDGQTCIYVIHIPKKNEWKLDYGEWQATENVFFGEYIDYRDLNWTLTHWMPLPAAPKEEK